MFVNFLTNIFFVLFCKPVNRIYYKREKQKIKKKLKKLGISTHKLE